MATFFGEVLPVTSRAVDDDEDEDDTAIETICPCIQWSTEAQNSLDQSAERKLDCSLLILAIGPAAVGFADIFMKQSNFELVAGISCETSDSQSQTGLDPVSPSKSSSLFRSVIDFSVFLCQCHADVPVEQCFAWTEQLFTSLAVAEGRVVVLNTLPTRHFTSRVPTSDLSVPLLRTLHTSRWANQAPAPPGCKALEQPNLVTGLAAQVLTYCQVHSIRAILYQCYTDARKLVDVATIKTFLPLLQSSPLKQFAQNNPEAEQRMKEIARQHQVHDTLYL